MPPELPDNQIDISLSLIGGEGLTALNALKDALVDNTKAMNEILSNLTNVQGSTGTPMRPTGQTVASTATAGRAPEALLPGTERAVSERGPQPPAVQQQQQDAASSSDDPGNAGFFQRQLSRFAGATYGKLPVVGGPLSSLTGRLGSSLDSAMPWTEGQWLYNNLGKAFNALSPEGNQALGEQAGYTRPDSIAGNIPIFGALWGGASQAGITETWDAIKEAATHGGISLGDARAINAELTNLGWGAGAEKGDLYNMQQLMYSLKQVAPGMDVATAGVYADQSVRYGGSSGTEIVQTAAQFNTAANAAKMSVNEFAKAVSEAAKNTEQMGGTFQDAVAGFTQWSRQSGLPPQVLSQVTQEPFVQMNTLARTGLFPWEQGVLMNRNGDHQYFQQTANSLMKEFMPTFLGMHRGQKLPPGVSAQDLAFADMSKFIFPGIDRKTLRYMYYTQQSERQRHAVDSDVTALRKQKGPLTKTPAWHDLMKNIVPANYRNRADTQAEIQKLEKNFARNPRGAADDLQAWINTVTGDGGKRRTGPEKVLIGLTPNAARIFTVIGPQGQLKKDANAGGLGVNNGVTKNFNFMGTNPGNSSNQPSPYFP